MEPLTLLFISTSMGLILLVYCIIYSYLALFRTDKLLEFHLENKDIWWMKGLPSRFYTKKNYRHFLIVMGILFVIFGLSMVITNIYIFRLVLGII